MTYPTFTDHALAKMRSYGISETQVLDVFNHGTVEKRGGESNAIKKYSNYEVGVYYAFNSGKYIIISVWKRGRR